MNFYLGGYGNGASGYQPLIGARYFDKSGQVEPRHRPRAGRSFLRWQKSLIDFFGYDNLVRWQAGAGDEFAPSHPFETGKLAMMLDGEWRVAFIKNEHPELKYATAPMPVADGHPELYGAGRGQRDDHRHPEGRQEPRPGVGPRQVPDDERPRAREVLERDPERPVDGQLRALAGADPGQELRDVPEDLRQPELADDADHADRPRPPDDVHELHRQVAGRQGEAAGSRRRAEGRRQADRREDQAGGQGWRRR